MTKRASLITETDDDSFWGDELSIVAEETPTEQSRVFDLEERTARFGEAVIDFAKLIPRGPLADRLIGQLVGCGTSVGANYSEADDAVSKKAFFLSINTCRRESREAKHFLRMVVRAVPELKDVARPLWREEEGVELDLFEDLSGEMTKPESMTNDKARRHRLRHWGFGFVSDFVIRASSFPS